jgi:SPP1 family predicted phage head-tail adaptor
MQAGKLRHKVTIEQLLVGSPQDTPEGAPDAAWTIILPDIWAAVEPLQGRELFAAQEHHSEVTTRIRIRYRPGITAAMRVAFDGRLYNIRSIIDREERHRELQLLCTEGVNDG